MPRKLLAITLSALAGAALACDDGPRGSESASYAPDDGVPDKAAEVRTTTAAKETASSPAAPVATKKQQAEPKRKTQGKALNS